MIEAILEIFFGALESRRFRGGEEYEIDEELSTVLLGNALTHVSRLKR